MSGSVYCPGRAGIALSLLVQPLRQLSGALGAERRVGVGNRRIDTLADHGQRRPVAGLARDVQQCLVVPREHVAHIIDRDAGEERRTVLGRGKRITVAPVVIVGDRTLLHLRQPPARHRDPHRFHRCH